MKLDAIDVCRGYVRRSTNIALQNRRLRGEPIRPAIVSTSGKQDGLAWHSCRRHLGGPIGEKELPALSNRVTPAVRSRTTGISSNPERAGTCRAARTNDFVVKGVMIGGFALVAAPAEYSVTGVRPLLSAMTALCTRRTSGRPPIDAFIKTERFNPERFVETGCQRK